MSRPRPRGLAAAQRNPSSTLSAQELANQESLASQFAKIFQKAEPPLAKGAPRSGGDLEASARGSKFAKPTLGLFRHCVPKKWRSRPISRVLSWTVIPLGASSPIRSSNLHGPDAGNVMGSLFGLAPGGVCRTGLLPGSRCALTAPFHPYLIPPHPEVRWAIGGIFLLHFPSTRAAQALPGTVPCGARTFLGTAHLHVDDATVWPTPPGSILRPCRLMPQPLLRRLHAPGRHFLPDPTRPDPTRLGIAWHGMAQAVRSSGPRGNAAQVGHPHPIRACGADLPDSGGFPDRHQSPGLPSSNASIATWRPPLASHTAYLPPGYIATPACRPCVSST